LICTDKDSRYRTAKYLQKYKKHDIQRYSCSLEIIQAKTSTLNNEPLVIQGISLSVDTIDNIATNLKNLQDMSEGQNKSWIKEDEMSTFPR